jgi:hypothetical protein
MARVWCELLAIAKLRLHPLACGDIQILVSSRGRSTMEGACRYPLGRRNWGSTTERWLHESMVAFRSWRRSSIRWVGRYRVLGTSNCALSTAPPQLRWSFVTRVQSFAIILSCIRTAS